MKSQQRHELKSHELQKLVARISPVWEAYGNGILLVVAAVILVAGVAVWLVRSSNASVSAGWTRYAACRDAEMYANVADDFPDTEVGAWARLKEAEAHLQSGVRLSFEDRSAGVSDLKKAKESFDKLLEAGSVPATVRERGLYGLARCLETTSDGDTGAAVKSYEKLLKEFPETIYKELAEERREDLKTGSTQDFYAWFHKQKPNREDRANPFGGFPTGHPPFDSGNSFGQPTLPEIPDLLQMPDAPDDAASPDEADAPDAPADNGKQPAPDKNDSAGNKPSVPESKSDKPSTTPDPK